MDNLLLSFIVPTILVVDILIVWLVVLAVRREKRNSEKIDTLLRAVEGLRRNEETRLLKEIASFRSREKIEVERVGPEEPETWSQS